MFAKNIRYLREKRKWTQRDLANKLGYKSSVAIHHWEKGDNSPTVPALNRVADILGVPAHDLINVDIESKERDALANVNNISTPAARAVPILGTICCGAGIDAIENFDGLFFIDQSVRADLCLHVAGDSMIDVGIRDGDIAFVIKNCSYINGKLYAVRFIEDDTAIIRKLYWRDGALILQACNDAYEPTISSEAAVQIIGGIIGVYHDLEALK